MKGFCCDRCGKFSKQISLKRRGIKIYASDENKWGSVIDICEKCYEEFRDFMQNMKEKK